MVLLDLHLAEAKLAQLSLHYFPLPRAVRSIRKVCLRSSRARAELVSSVMSYNTAGSVHCGQRELSC